MRDHLAQGDVILVHQPCGEFGGSFNGGRAAVASVFAHFDGDAVVVSRSVKIGVFSLLVGGQVLDGYVLIHGVVPRQVSDAVSAPAFVSAESAGPECLRVPPGISAGGVVLGAVDGDIPGAHTAAHLSPVPSFRNVAFVDIDFAVESCRTF